MKVQNRFNKLIKSSVQNSWFIEWIPNYLIPKKKSPIHHYDQQYNIPYKNTRQDKSKPYHNQKTCHHGSIFQTLAGVNHNVNVIVLWQISVACRAHYYLKRTYDLGTNDLCSSNVHCTACLSDTLDFDSWFVNCMIIVWKKDSSSIDVWSIFFFHQLIFYKEGSFAKI